MSLRDMFRVIGVPVGDLPDWTLEAVQLDLAAEFGEITPTVDQIRTIVERHRAKPEPEASTYVPSIQLRDLLDFEAGEHGERKDRLIREVFEVSPARYQLLLTRALDDPASMEIAPTLVAHLRSVRDRRRELRQVSA